MPEIIITPEPQTDATKHDYKKSTSPTKRRKVSPLGDELDESRRGSTESLNHEAI